MNVNSISNNNVILNNTLSTIQNDIKSSLPGQLIVGIIVSKRKIVLLKKEIYFI
jgi:hypothetical protein